MSTGDWSDEEVEATVDVYFQMLTLELAGEPYVKAEFHREVAKSVDRSMGAISKKFSNVSAALDDLNALWIPGFKPLANAQQRLRDVVRDRFERDAELRAFMLQAVTDQDIVVSEIGVEIEPPDVDLSMDARRSARATRLDYAAIEAANRALGKAGEDSVVATERGRLTQGGRSDLAARVRHVSVEVGDGLGYDIQSFVGLTEEPAYIEVKTTKYAKELPFFVSANEVAVSNDLGPSYQLWRVFRYGRSGAGFYAISGPLERNAQLRPATFLGVPRSAIND
ncbi:DUF3883 domain-containing protein [Nocardioides sp.]|uniref:DUF3883 domain-containing protein n=1 Tax=Nocardioides sp. TaxID=35761 RepID=UPI0035B02DF2